MVFLCFTSVRVLHFFIKMMSQRSLLIETGLGARQDFSKGGGGGSHCVTPGVLSKLLCRHACYVSLKVTFFSDEKRG